MHQLYFVLDALLKTPNKICFAADAVGFGFVNTPEERATDAPTLQMAAVQQSLRYPCRVSWCCRKPHPFFLPLSG